MLDWLRSAPKPPISEAERAWIEGRFNWLTKEFGPKRLLTAPLILPTSAFFPSTYHGTEAELVTIMARVAEFMDIDPGLLRLNFYVDSHPKFEGQWNHGTAGLYLESDGYFDIWLEASKLEDPLGVVATVAHEIGHVILLGQRRVSPDEEDHELLTDLVTVFMGMGIFSANSVIQEGYWWRGISSGWSMARQGYMSMNMHGYALALYALARSDLRPRWASYLRPDVRSALKQSLRFIQKTDECTCAFPET